jgi:hypothetical protein
MVDKIQYEIILYWGKEDQAFIAEIPELPTGRRIRRRLRTPSWSSENGSRRRENSAARRPSRGAD